MCFSLILLAEALIHAKPEVLNYFLKSHCFDCHDNEIQKGKLNLEALPFQLDNQKIFTVLPENEILRLYDNVPLKAQAQTLMGNRLVYGNYYEGYNLRCSGKCLPL